MTLIVVLACLAIERYLQLGSALNRFAWLSAYTHLLQHSFPNKLLWHGWLGIIAYILPILAVVALIFYVADDWLWGIMGLAMSIVIVLYCLSPDEDSEETQRLPYDFFQAIFSVIFWYVLLGPLAAIAYRLIERLHTLAHRPESELVDIAPQLDIALNVFEWLPARLLALFVSLAGDFNRGFALWFAGLTQGLVSQRQMVTDTSNAAAGENCGRLELTQLLDRGLIIALVLLALLSLLIGW